MPEFKIGIPGMTYMNYPGLL